MLAQPDRPSSVTTPFILITVYVFRRKFGVTIRPSNGIKTDACLITRVTIMPYGRPAQPTETFEMRNRLLTSSLEKPRQNAEAILEAHALFIYEYIVTLPIIL